MTATGRLTFTTTMRVIDWVHGHTTNRWSHATPALRAGLTERAQAVLTVTHFTKRCAAFAQHASHLT
jgi:hypothetical protein